MSSITWLSLKMHLPCSKLTPPKTWPLVPDLSFAVVYKKWKYKTSGVAVTLDSDTTMPGRLTRRSSPAGPYSPSNRFAALPLCWEASCLQIHPGWAAPAAAAAPGLPGSVLPAAPLSPGAPGCSPGLAAPTSQHCLRPQEPLSHGVLTAALPSA